VKLAIVIQARTGSSRLPGKVLLPLAGKPLLERMIERVRGARRTPSPRRGEGRGGGLPFEIVVATTTDPSDDPIVELCRTLDVRCHRGHPTDLLDRHIEAARAMKADTVAKIPSDCPLIDPRVIETVLEAFSPDRHDYVGNLHPATWPDGNDVEVMPVEALELAWREATKPHEREHTTPFLWDQPDRFRLANVAWDTGLDYSMSHRFTIDYPEDYDFIRAVYDELHDANTPFSCEDIVRLCEARPDIFALNSMHAGVNWYRHHLDDLRTVDASMTRREK
jgi:spore coat polysaccharide biosynthesis protein SpsF